MENQCVTCREEVNSDDKAILCDLCDSWEHVVCIRKSERPSEALYEAMVSCRSKAIVFACTSCQKRGSIVKRLMQYEYESARAEDERLASARLLEERDRSVASLQAEIQKLRVEKDNMNERLLTMATIEPTSRLSAEPRTLTSRDEVESNVKNTPAVTGSSVEELQRDPSQSDSSSSSEQSSDEQPSTESRDESRLGRRASCRPHPPGFKELSGRVEKFSGRTGDCDFELWLEDFEEASRDCGWNDKQRAQWFSWFITGPAKTTWQKTLKSDEKASWKAIKKVYQGQYGIHLDPRTAYQRCHELRYDQFNSVQGLLDAMRDYQRMAPQKLRDETLESILWNKVPIELQQEVREITDGSVQELLQKLLKAESVIAERKRRNHTRQDTRETQAVRNRTTDRLPTGRTAEGPQTNSTVDDTNPTNTLSRRSRQSMFRGEASRQYVKCFNCKRKGHLAADCPDTPRRNATEAAWVIEPGDITKSSEQQNPWILTVSTSENTTTGMDGVLPRRGPTYKVVAEVDGVRTRALLDHDAQISLVCQELLPVIQKKQGWTMEQCEQRNMSLDSQPIGASGDTLGVMAVVMLKINIVGDSKSFITVPCYVLKSDKPLWKGELSDCALVLGTNALGNLGFQITHPNGSAVQPVGTEAGTDVKGVQPSGKASVHVILDKKLHLGPFQSRVAKVRVGECMSTPLGMIMPNTKLSDKCCDFIEQLWEGKSTRGLSITNWSGEPLVIEPGTVISDIEEVSVVNLSDPRVENPIS